MIDDPNVKAKITKLLALSESPNENEARQALLKAKELMRQHQLSERDLDGEGSLVVHRETAITFSKRRASWTLQLAGVIAENYCCRAFSRRRSRQQTRCVVLAGLPGDVEICEKVLTYALSCINAWIRSTTSLNHELYTTKELGVLAGSYAKGYIAGIYLSYRRRVREPADKRSLVPKASGEVDRSVENMPTERIASEDEIVRSIYNVGLGDGLRFNVSNKLPK